MTNSEKSKISSATKNILVEITSSVGIDVCKKVMEELVLEMIRSNITSSNELGEKVQAMSINSETAKSVDVAKETEHNLLI